MRPKERIPIFLSKVNWKTLAERWNIDVKLFNKILNMKGTLRPKIIYYWKEDPDLRFGQMLINIGCISNSLRIWNDEENDILEDQGIPFREFMLWSRHYDENMNPLPEVERILIKDMTTNHIKAIIRDVGNGEMAIRGDYLQAFKDEIKLRNE